MSNDLVPATQSLTFSDIERLAHSVVKSKLFGVSSPEQALVLMMIAQAEGRHPMLAARDYDVIQGKPAKKAEAMLRDFLMAGGKVEWHSLSDTGADATFTHPTGGSVRVEWTMDRAKKAGILGNAMWTKYPRQMLRSRTVSEGVRTVWPVATSGMYVPEEVHDINHDRPAKTVLQSKPLPEAKTIDVPHDPETGELGPHEITGLPTPVAWGTAFVTAIGLAADHTEIAQWHSYNQKNLTELEAIAPKLYAKVFAKLEEAYAKFRTEPNPDVAPLDPFQDDGSAMTDHDPDREYAEQLADLIAATSSEEQLDSLYKGKDVQTQLKSWRKERPYLSDIVDAAYKDKAAKFVPF